MNGRRTAISAFAAAAFCIGVLAPAGAHELRRGRLTLPAGSPIMGQTADMQVVIVGADEKPTPLIDTQVYVTADMTAHPMAPVTAELATLVGDRTRSGKIDFTMPGQWRLKLEIVEVDEDERVAIVPLRVLGYGSPPSAAPLTIDFGLDVPLRPTVFDPWMVVWTTLGLVVVLEGLAIGRYMWRGRSSRSGGLLASGVD